MGSPYQLSDLGYFLTHPELVFSPEHGVIIEYLPPGVLKFYLLELKKAKTWRVWHLLPVTCGCSPVLSFMRTTPLPSIPHTVARTSQGRQQRFSRDISGASFLFVIVPLSPVALDPAQEWTGVRVGEIQQTKPYPGAWAVCPPNSWNPSLHS